MRKRFALLFVFLLYIAAPSHGARLVRTLHQGPELTALALSPDGTLLAAASGDFTSGTIWLWNLRLHRPSVRLCRTSESVTLLAFSPDNHTLACCVEQFGRGQIFLLNARTRRKQHTLTLSKEVCQMVFSPDGQTLAITDGTASVRFYRPRTGRLQRIFRTRKPSTTLTFSPDSQTLATGWGKDDGLGGVRVWNVKTGRLRWQATEMQWHTPDRIIPLPYPILALAFSPDSKTLLCGSELERGVEGYGGYLVRQNARTGRHRKVFETEYKPDFIAYSQDGKTLVVPDSSLDEIHAPSFFDARTLKVRQVLKDNSGDLIAFAPNSGLLATGSDKEKHKGRIQLWKMSGLTKATRKRR